MKLDQIDDKAKPFEEKLAQCDQTLAKLRDLLKADMPAETAGKTYSVADLKEMAGKVIQARKSAEKQIDGFKTARDNMRKVVADLSKQQQALETRLTNLQGQVAKLDAEMAAAKAMKQASASTGDKDATLAANLDSLEEKVASLSADVRAELQSEASADWTFNCPRCNSLQSPTGDNASLFWCPDCGYKSEHTLGYLKSSKYLSPLQEAAYEQRKAKNAKPTEPPADAATKPGGEASPLYCDCANCGTTLDITGVASHESVFCPYCGVMHATRAGVLNLRSTLQQEEQRGLLGRLFLGSTIQKSNSEKREEAIESFRQAIARENAMRMSAAINHDYLAAQYYLRNRALPKGIGPPPKRGRRRVREL